MNRDLGTYYIRVELQNGEGYIERINTCARYTSGRGDIHPLNARRINPTWEDEADLESTLVFSYTENNNSCDCNKLLSLDRANQIDSEEDYPCGDTLVLRRLTLIRPDGSEKVIYESTES